MSGSAERITVVHGTGVAADDPTVEWALGYLEAALRRRGIALAREGEGAQTLRVLCGPSAEADAAALGRPLPTGPEALALFRAGSEVAAWGSDRRGLAYALTELADRTIDPTGDRRSRTFATHRRCMPVIAADGLTGRPMPPKLRTPWKIRLKFSPIRLLSSPTRAGRGCGWP